MHVPWAMLFRGDTANLLGSATISAKSFAPSDTDPAILSVQAGALVRDDGLQIEPVRRLDILLYSGSGKFLGVMARLRDLLPGSYSFGITGRGPTSTRLAARRRTSCGSPPGRRCRSTRNRNGCRSPSDWNRLPRANGDCGT